MRIEESELYLVCYADDLVLCDKSERKFFISRGIWQCIKGGV